MRTINIYEAKTKLSQLVQEVASGRDVVIARAGRPVARLTRVQTSERRRRLGLLDGRLRIQGDFSQPLPDKTLRSFEED